MAELRKIKVKVMRGESVFIGKFHQWYTKVWEDRGNQLYALVEDEKGEVRLYDFDSYQFTFVDKESTDNVILPISGGA